MCEVREMKSSGKYIVEKEVCGTCAHYRQHYVLEGGQRFHPLWYGHCHVPRWGKHPAPDQTCPHWTPREPDPGE